jgi:hypothetical protein
VASLSFVFAGVAKKATRGEWVMEDGRNPVLERIVTMEMGGVVEFWNVRGGGVHILLALPAHVCACRQPHTWFVNRDGRTRCCDCDVAYQQERQHLPKSMVAA